MLELEAGADLDGYHLESVVAKSGMATVYRAIERASGEVVAIKIPHFKFESDVVFFERFRREQRVGCRLSHPSLVKVHANPGASRPYIVMELLTGPSLRAAMEDGKNMPVERALTIARRLCEALDYMHRQGVVHRDMKPENVFLGADDAVKIIDFGIAMDRTSRRVTWTRVGPTMGTPDYMAPEQLQGKRGEPRSDIYAVGTILYEMLTGTLPYPENDVDVLRHAKRDPPEPPTTVGSLRRGGGVASELDSDVDAIVLQALEPDARRRYSTAAAFAADLASPIGAGQRIAADHAGWAATEGDGESGRRRHFAAVCLVLSALSALVWMSHVSTSSIRTQNIGGSAATR